jgi:predicted metal-dependent hydrolase
MLPLLPHYRHIVNPKLKYIYLSFDDKGTLIIKSPKVSQSQIEKLLLKKSSWITKSQQKLQNKKGRTLDFNQNCELYFLGESHLLVLKVYDKKHTKLTFDGDIFTLYYSTYNEVMFQRHIDTFYKIEAQHYIPNIVEQWSTTMAVKYRNLSFRKTKRQWGSCSSKNDLSFNTMMMKLPLDVIQYIIIHELAHITHKHHQKEFWARVERYLPDHKIQVKKLKEYNT